MTDSIVEFDAGATSSGEAVRGFHLESAAGVRIMLLSYGAHLVSVELPDPGAANEWAQITDGPTTVTELEQPGARYQGATIGRYANRIADARFILDGVQYELPANHGSHHLHGGPDGFAFQIWEAEPVDDDEPGVGVRFELSSPAGDSGYPGAMRVQATHRLVEDRLDVVYEAVTDAATPISLTNHAYWNLRGSGAGASIADHTLTVHSDRVLIPDAGGIPQSGPPVPVAGTRFALHEAPLETVLETGGLDHCYVNPAIGSVVPMIELRHAPSGRSLSVDTDQPGVQVYTGNHFDPPYRSIAFEPQAWPDSPNRTDFPSAILRPGETYRRHTIYRFEW